MNIKILFLLLSVSLAACRNNHLTDIHEEHEEVEFKYVSYNPDYELFAEAGPLIAGESANVLSHISGLPDLRAVETGKSTLILKVNDSEIVQTLEKPTRKGIYNFNITPGAAGVGTMKFILETEKGTSELLLDSVKVYGTHEEAHEDAEEEEISKANTTVFTKEQSWKVNFTTSLPSAEPFGPVIRTTAIIQPSLNDEHIVAGKISGIVTLSSNVLQEGTEVKSGQVLFKISGNESSENNFSVRFTEAVNNFERAEADYERASDLAQDKIISEKEMLNIRIQYENAKAAYENLNRNFNNAGQNVVSPVNGFIRQLYVKNGSYVDAGQPVLIISQNKRLNLVADVPQRYAPILNSIKSANIRNLSTNEIYSLEQLDGRILSYGKSANQDNYLIPVNLQISNKKNFIPGSFVEVYLKTVTNSNAITVPNTALMEDQGTFSLYVQVDPELFEKREVTVGMTDGLRTEIMSGISVEDRIVTKGANLIKLSQSTGTLDAHAGHVH